MNRTIRWSVVLTAVFGIVISGLLATAGPLVSSAWAITIHVDDDNCPGPGDGSEANPYCSIQTAITAATSGVDEVLVHDGTYVENITFSGKAITLRSLNGPDFTTIDGNAGGSVVTFDAGETPDSRLDGFKITNGNNAYGGGVLCENASSPTIRNCVISNNSAINPGLLSGVGVGGGIYCGNASSPAILNCIIHSNFAQGIEGGLGGGIYCANASSPTIEDCTIRNNAVSSVAIMSLSRKGGGIYCSGADSAPVVIRTTISDNRASYGGGIYCSSDSLSLVNCTIAGNGGSGLYCQDISPSLVNCTIGDNSKSGVYCSGTTAPDLVNCILWGNGYSNSPSEVYLSDFSSGINIAYSVIDPDEITGNGTPSLSNNINVNPEFVGNGDYHLEMDSPCIDAGTGDLLTYPDLPSRDIDGDPRPQHAAYDMGSDELRVYVPGHYPSIQGAIDAAIDGWIIVVRNGTYTENIDFLGKAITVQSENGPQHTTIDGSSGGSVVTFDSGENENAMLAGFTLTNGSGTASGDNVRGGGIYCQSASPRLKNLIITDNAIAGPMLGNSYGGGLYCDASSPALSNCLIRNNRADGPAYGGGMYCTNASSPTLVNCLLIDNHADYQGGGIYCSSSAPTIVNSILLQDTAGAGHNEVHLADSGSTITISYSDLDPVAITGPGTSSLSNTINADPQFTGSGDYHLNTGSPCIDAGDPAGTSLGYPAEDLEGTSRPQDGTGDGVGRYDMGIYEHVGYVVTVPGDHGTIQEAIDAAINGCTIIVQDGVYPEYIDFNGKAVTVQSVNGPQHTTIDGGGSRNVVRFISGETADSVLDGFTIQNGQSDVGGGIACIGTSPIIRDCIITGNSAINPNKKQGGGIFCDNASPLITGCIISSNNAENEGGGIYACNASWPRITDCTIRDNSAGDGGGVYFDASFPVIEKTLISENQATNGAGLYCYYASLTLSKSTITGNWGTHGGGLYCEASSPFITNSTFTGNRANWDGGAVYCSEGSPTLAHCTISSNNAIEYGGGICVRLSSSPFVINSIIWGNRASGSPNDVHSWHAQSGITISYSDVNPAHITGLGSTTLSNNINADPLFVDPRLASEAPTTQGDYHLTPGSPCMDAGTDVISPQPVDDIDGNPRPMTNGYDMGSDELPIALVPSADFSSIQAAIDAAQDGWTILVADGTYNENINFKGKAITLRSENGPDDTTIDGNHNGTVVTFDSGEGASTVLNGFTIKNGASSEGGGIYCSSSSPTISNCTITENTAIGGPGGGLSCNASSPAIIHCTFSVNSAGSSGGGIYCGASSSPIVINSILWNDLAATGGDEIFLDGTSSIDVSYSDVQGGWTGGTNIDAEPLFVGSGDYHLTPGSPCVNAGTDTHPTVSLPTDDIDGDMRPLFDDHDMGSDEINESLVGPSGAHYTSIQAAIDAAIDGATIIVLDGTYVENINFNGMAITVRSKNGPEFATIDGNDNGSVVTFVSGERETTVLEGFTLTNGQATYGGGIYFGPGTTPTVKKCTINDNLAAGEPTTEGGGIYCDNASPTITDCIITGNGAENVHNTGKGGGIYAGNASWPQISGCTIRDNNADFGGGVYFEASFPTIENSFISENQAKNSAGIHCSSSSLSLADSIIIDNSATDFGSNGGGMYCDSSSPSITNCTFAGNSAMYGAGISCRASSSPSLSNCTITGNDGDYGGGIYCNDSPPSITNCTISANRSSINGGAILCTGNSNLIATNSIFWGNVDGSGYNEIHASSGSTVDITYSNIQGGGLGATNIDEIPLFVDARLAADAPTSEGDYHLTPISPCRDAGTGTHASLTIPDDDIDGDARPMFAGYDMGADEIITAVVAPAGGNFASIQAAIDAADDGSIIIVQDGTYEENINFNGKAVTIRSENGPDKAIIDGSLTPGTLVTFNNGEGPDSVLEGFTVTNGASENGGGMACYGTSPTIRNCFITVNAALGASDRLGGGLYCYNASPTLTNCTIAGNSAGAGLLNGNGGAIYCHNSSPVITNCTIADNRTIGIAPANGGGIYCTPGSSPVVVNTILWGNTAATDGNQIFVDGTSAIDVTYSDVQGGYAGDGNIDADPLFTSDGYYHLTKGSPCEDTGTGDSATYPQLPDHDIDGDDRPLDGGYDMGSDEYRVVFVPDDFVTIQEAIDKTPNGNRIIVRPETYNENINFKGKSVTLISERGADETVIDGGGAWTVVTFNSGEGPGSELDGFTITNGGGGVGNPYGGGIYCQEASPKITNCNITGNIVPVGGGVMCYYSAATFINCTIANNEGVDNGGGIACISASPAITNCTIADNVGGIDGGGILSLNAPSPLTVVNSIIWGNTAAGSPNDFHLYDPTDVISIAYSNFNPSNKAGAGTLSEVEKNLYTDPLFAGGGNYHLAANSPNIDKGTDDTGSYPHVPDHDIDGDSRPLRGGHDIGSDEVACPDLDEDTYFAEEGCGTYLDCNDDAPDVYPGAPELCDYRDNDCDELTDADDPDFVGFNVFYHDSDEDSFGDPGDSAEACEAPPGYVANNGDWDDDDADVYPGAPELVDGKDNDGDGHVDEINVGSDVGGEDDFGTIQAAINAATPGQTIIVRAGTYLENIDFIGKAITVVSADGPEVTAIDGSPGMPVGSVVTFRDGEGPDAILDGFTIKNGDGTETYTRGGGIYCINNSSATIRNCIIQNNYAYYFGGGVYIVDSPDFSMEGCTITGNTADSRGGGLYAEDSTVTLTDCVVEGNTANPSGNWGGGGIYAYEAEITLSGCTIDSNVAAYGGGIYSRSTLSMSGCRIRGNTASSQGGGLYDTYGNSTIHNCQFTGNAANQGGGVFDNATAATYYHCTVSGNTALYRGGGMHTYTSPASTIIVNSIVWGNLAGTMGDDLLGAFNVAYSDIGMGDPAAAPYTGTGNINNEPLFADPVPATAAPTTLGAYHLLETSDCIDAGTDDGVTYPGLPLSHDIHGDARFQGLGHDMGSDEYVEYTAAPAAPGALAATATSAVAIGLTWEDNADNEQGFELYRKTDMGGPFSVVAVLGPDTEAYQDTNLTPDTEYYYQVLAYNNIGDSTFSNEANATTLTNNHIPVCHSGDTSTPIQDAINIAQDGDVIIVCDGTFVERIDFLGKAITVRSEHGPGSTTIDGDSGGPVVTFASGEKENSALEGFTITNGADQGGIYCKSFMYTSPQISDCLITANTTRGVYAEFSSLRLDNCTVSNHQNNIYGCGVYLLFGEPRIDNSTITNNGALNYSGGGIYADRSFPVVNNTIISDNSGYWGGGVYSRYGEATFTGCTIANNTARLGGGVYGVGPLVFSDCTIDGNTTGDETVTGSGGGIYAIRRLSMTNCMVSGNMAVGLSGSPSNGGGIYTSGTESFITNSFITGNSATQGGGLYRQGEGLTVINSTFSGNYASRQGGGIHTGWVISVINSIVWGNSADSFVDNIQGALADVTYSNIGGGFSGAGNIDADPEFVNARPALEAPTTAGDYHLLETSPCIDAGSNADVPAWLVEDFDGDDRIVDSVDMGADEFNPFGGPCEGDFDGDDDVDAADLAALVDAYGYSSGHVNFNPDVDLDSSGTVDKADLELFAPHFGRTDCP